MSYYEEFSLLLGEVITAIEINKDSGGCDEIIFTLKNGKTYKLFHDQDCCESVYVDDITGDPLKLIGDPLVLAEENSNKDGLPAPEYPDSWTWTFYRLATRRNSVVIKWLGESNGYYSESVDFKEVTGNSSV